MRLLLIHYRIGFLGAVILLFFTACEKKPEACFVVSKAEVEINEKVLFTNCSVDAYSYFWNFEDGTTSREENPEKIYTTEGTYKVTLIAYSKHEKKSSTATKIITVTKSTAPPVADFTATPTTGTAPLTVYFTNLSSDTSNTLWGFGDTYTSTDVNPSHTYNLPGQYTVSLTVSNEYGTDTEVKENYITVTALK